MPISSTWLWIAAGLYLLFEIWRGWRRGVVRHGVSVLALISAGGVGWIFAWMTGFLADRVIPFPYPVGRIIFGLTAAVAFYVVAAVLSSLLFKKTSQQRSGLVRLIFGVGGGVFGLIFGLLMLWGGISLVRMVGAVAEGEQRAPARGAVATALDPSLISAKEALESGSTGSWVDHVDILPSNIYPLITKVVQVTQSPDAVARFLFYPGTQQLLSSTKLGELFTDPAMIEAASQGNVFALLSQPKLQEVAADPAVREAIANFDLENALDYAMQETPPSPVSTP
jgi:hypothetical protein